MKRLVLFALVVLLAGAAAWLLWGGSYVDVIDVNPREPGKVALTVASCNGAPEVIVAEEKGGRYEVRVRTTQSWNRGQECADIVEIVVDEDLKAIEIYDTNSGTSFLVGD